MDAFRQLITKPWLYLAVVICGTLLKFYNLEYKLFWRDEIATVLYVSGVKESPYINDIPINEIKSIDFYNSLLQNSKKSNTLKSEITGIFSNTHLTPAHYVFLTIWYRLVGDNDMDYRWFSVLMFVLSLPFIFLLAKILFTSNLAGWITTSLYAVSPFINCQAQEARYYIVWVFFFILSNCLFLIAIKHNKTGWWITYAIASILALYASILSGLFLFGHLVYILWFRKEVWSKFAFSLLFIFLAYLPWLYFLYTVRNAIESGMSWHTYNHPSLFSLELLFFQVLGWTKAFTYISDFTFYFMLFDGTLHPELYLGLLVDLVVLCLIGWAVWYLIRKSSQEIRWFLILIILPLFMFFYVSDIFRNGLTSIVWRYHVVNMVGITIVVANLLYDKISKGKLVYAGFYIGLIFLSITAILRIEKTRCWNTSPDCQSIINIAQVLSQATHPLIITDFGGIGEYGFDNFLAIINESELKNADIMYCKGAIPDIKKKTAGIEYSEIFVLHASEEFVKDLQSQYGDSFVLHRKEDNEFLPQIIWQIKL